MNESANKETLLNPLLFKEKENVKEERTINLTSFEDGTLVNDKYVIVKKLTNSSTICNVYIAKYNEDYFTLKVYNSSFDVPLEIIDILMKIESIYLEKIYEYFTLENGNVVIISAYYAQGTLANNNFTLKELKELIIPSLNEAIHTLHLHKILHMDLKPSNIMLSNNRQNVVLIDFSSSLLIKDEREIIVKNKLSFTPHYSAIETCTSNQCSIYSDYYSMGITIYELLLHHSPFMGLNDEGIIRVMQTNRIFIEDGVDLSMRDLIYGLTYRDIANRNDYQNSNVRWSYQQVKDWLAGKTLVVPGEGILSNTNMLPITFKEKNYTDIDSLIADLALNWDEGIRFLSNGKLSNYFKNVNHQYFEITIQFESKFFDKEKKVNSDVEFFNYIYTILPQLNKFYYKGQVYESIQDLGFNLLDKLDGKKETEMTENYYKSLLKNKILSSYCALKSIDNLDLVSMIKEIENTYQSDLLTIREKQKALYTLSYILTGQKEYRIENEVFTTKDEFISYIISVYEKSFADLNKLAKTLMPRRNLEAKLEAWLCALGYQNELENFRRMLNVEGEDEE